MDELNAGVKTLESWGYQVRIPKDLFGKHWTHSHSDEVRFQHLKDALYSDSSAIWCVRGGYGSLKLLPFLSKLKKPKQCKLFLGLSDITSLHLFFNQRWGWPTLHSPIITRLGIGNLPSRSINELKKIISGKVIDQKFNLKPLNFMAKQAKKISGIIVGGNFVTLMASIGTPYQWRAKDSILFLEDVGERAYRLDRLWEQLEQTGLLSQAKAVVFGDFTDTEELNGKSYLSHFFEDRAKASKLPIYFGLPVGHGPIQRTLALGVNAVITDQKLKLQTGVRNNLR
jgi:muramoyltetrapeptide carboxypeptidase